MKQTIIISGFPGIGKSYLTELFEDTEIIMKDSDSSKFSWLEPGVRNPDFPNNYIKHIKDMIGQVDYIFISSHENVRNKLAEENIQYVLVYPDKSLYNEYIDRYTSRGSDYLFVANMMRTFSDFVKQCEDDRFAIKVKLNSGEYLIDVIDAITYTMENLTC